jgi:mono/diheme cytochrome c family protein
MPDFRLSADELDALDAFLAAQRATPPLDASRVDWSGADPERGRELYARARCVTCHRIDERGGTTGPDLSTIGSRTSREWLWSYIQEPFREQPDTLMPRFSLAADDLRDITSYLAEELTDPDAPPAPAAVPATDARAIEAGRQVFIKRGCFGCHRITGTEDLAKIGPVLAGIGDRAVDVTDFRGHPLEPTLPNWLYTKVRAPQDLVEPSLMPTFALADRERLELVVALLSLTKREVPPSRLTHDPARPPDAPQGTAGALFAKYRCLSCHQLGGRGGLLSTVALDRIGSQLTPDWLRSFLREPSTVRVSVEVRMPRMGITADEADVLAEYASRALVDDRLASWTVPPQGAATAGADLYARLGCQGCHQVEGRGGYVGPDLSSVGRRLQPGWMKAWLLAPERWKRDTTQPDYGLTEDQATALTAYLLTLTRTEARR